MLFVKSNFKNMNNPSFMDCLLGSPLMRSVWLRQDSWYDPVVNPKTLDDMFSFVLTKLFEK